MSTPFPLEEQAQEQPEQTVNPWAGPAPTHWYSGMGFNEDTAYLGPLYRALEGAGEGAAKGEELLGGAFHDTGVNDPLSKVAGSGAITPEQRQAREELYNRTSDAVLADARERVKAMTPDPATTGAAVQVVHGLASGLTRYAVGSLAGGPLGGAVAVGSTEANDRYNDLIEQGLTPKAAAVSAGVEGTLAGAGAILPAGFGSSLVAKVVTGALGNLGFGALSRYTDAKTLELAGYPDMAKQQSVWDATSVVTDLLLGGAFGTLAHLHEPAKATPVETKARVQQMEASFGRNVPGAEDALLTANLAMRDRAASPGVPVDPGSANAHQAADETAIAQLLAGRSVNVAGTGVENATFAPRAARDTSDVQTLFANALHEGGLLDEQRNLADLEQALNARLRGEPAPEAPQPAAPSRARETPEQERTNNEPYLPSEPEMAAAGIARVGDNADRIALVARAVEANPARVESLAAEHQGDPNAFIEAARQVIHEHGQAAPGGEGGARSQGAAGELGGSGRPGGLELRAGGSEPAGEGAAAAESAGRGASTPGTAEPAATAAGAGYPVTEGPLAPPAYQAVNEKPDLTIPTDRGEVNAGDALADADHAVTEGERDIPSAITAAVNCFQRRGAG